MCFHQKPGKKKKETTFLHYLLTNIFIFIILNIYILTCVKTMKLFDTEYTLKCCK